MLGPKATLKLCVFIAIEDIMVPCYFLERVIGIFLQLFILILMDYSIEEKIYCLLKERTLEHSYIRSLVFKV